MNFHLNVDNYDSIVPLQVVYNLINQEFYYTVDFSKYNLNNKEATYYFSVSDNDKVNGFKTTTSNSFIYVAPTREEITQLDKEQFKQIEDLVDKYQKLVIRLSKKFQ